MLHLLKKRKTETYTTAQLLEGIRKHDSQVLYYIFQTYQQRIIYHVTSNKGSVTEGEDLFMEGMEVIFRKVQDSNFSLNHRFYTYFYEICRRLWLRKLRRKKYDSNVTIEDYRVQNIADDTQVIIEKTERYQLFREKIALLGKECQRLLQLSLNEGKKASEIVRIMGISSPANVRKRKHDCKKKLIQLIEKDKRFKELRNE